MGVGGNVPAAVVWNDADTTVSHSGAEGLPPH